MHYGIEVRVVRGFKYDGSPSGKVHVYDGLYKVVESWLEADAVLKFAKNIRNGQLQVRLRGYVHMDMSIKKEKVPVFLFNVIDDNKQNSPHVAPGRYFFRGPIS
ncbi:histone-lysine N-methyltransferase family member SUVH9-like protein [Tanacetum coccineum]